jgi:hypothetical protein
MGHRGVGQNEAALPFDRREQMRAHFSDDEELSVLFAMERDSRADEVAEPLRCS